jgi:hypothetical protein
VIDSILEQTSSEPEQALKRETVVWGFAVESAESWLFEEFKELDGREEGLKLM